MALKLGQYKLVKKIGIEVILKIQYIAFKIEYIFIADFSTSLLFLMKDNLLKPIKLPIYICMIWVNI